MEVAAASYSNPPGKQEAHRAQRYPAKQEEARVATRVQARTLRRARELVGSTEELARRLGESPLKVQQWIEGRAIPPDEVFLKAGGGHPYGAMG